MSKAMRPIVPTFVFGWLCLVTAIANLGGNVLMILLYQPLFKWLGVPLPADVYLFTLECVLSFTMGFVALLVFLKPSKAIGPLVIGIVGKGLYGAITYYFYAINQQHPFFLIFVVWDAAFVVIFFLYWIALASPDLLELQESVLDGIAPRSGATTRRALLIGFSLTKNGSKALERVQTGLTRSGYQADIIMVETAEQIFEFPMSFQDFVRIVLRAFIRRPAAISPLRLPPGPRDWDLVVVESPTWLLGAAAPVDSVLLDPDNRPLFEGRDSAALAVSRGAYQRTMTMLVRGLERCGANLVSARGYGHAGWEPRRLFSLWWYLIFRKEGYPPFLAEPHYGLTKQSLDELELWGADLARRTRTRPHWALLRGEVVNV